MKPARFLGIYFMCHVTVNFFVQRPCTKNICAQRKGGKAKFKTVKSSEPAGRVQNIVIISDLGMIF